MDQSVLKPGWKRRAAALVLAAICISEALASRSTSSRLNMCGGLLIAWNIAFIPAPPVTMPLSKVYEMARQGWRTPWYSKLMFIAAVVCLSAAQYYKFHGR